MRADTIVVNSTADPAGFNQGITVAGLGSTVTLRDAVNAVCNSGTGHTITFDPALAGQTIELSQEATSGSALLFYNIPGQASYLTIQGLTGPAGITIARAAGAPNMRLFEVSGTSIGTLTLNDLTLSGGHVPGEFGGAIFSASPSCSIVLNRCTVMNNTAFFGGGIYLRDLAEMTLNNCTVSGNTATDQGGGINSYKGSLTLNHTTIAGNTAPSAGGLYSRILYPLLVNTIIAQNTATVVNPDLAGDGISPSSHHNLIGGNVNLGTLANHGGPTPTYDFSGPSPAFDAGAAIGFTTDQRGVARPQGASPDIGAVEAEPAAPTFLTANSAQFSVGIAGSFTMLASGYPAPAFSTTDPLPAGVTLSSSGILSGTPAAGTGGSYPITVTASNGTSPDAAQSFTLTVLDLVVTTAVDEDNGSADPALGTGTSLREALNRAKALGGSRTIVFSPSLAGQTIQVTDSEADVAGASAFWITTPITIQGLTGDAGITIARTSASALRLFAVTNPGSLTLNDLTLANGSAQDGGAILSFVPLTLNRCTLTGNSATGLGGAIYANSLTMTNCTLAGNSADNQGGAIYTFTNAAQLKHVTVTANSAVNAGGGISGPANLTNCIVAGNLQGGAPSDLGGSCTGSGNIIGTGGSGGLTDGVNSNQVGLALADIKLGALADNGGPNATCSLLLDSPAVNAAVALGGVSTDQRGTARPQVGTADIGAYEYVPHFVVTTAVDENDGTSEPGVGTGTSLREALQDATFTGTAQTITFDPALGGQTVTLDSGWNDTADASALRVSTPVTIQGPSTAPGVTLKVADGVDKRHFLVEGSGALTLENLTLRDGTGDNGGAIWNFGSLTALACTFTGNHATSEGGAIQSWGDSPLLWLENSTFAGNSCDGNGTAILTGASANTLRHVTITGNTGGTTAFAIWTHQVEATNSLIAGNSVEGVTGISGGSFSATSANNLLSTGGGAGLTHGVNGNLVGIPASSLYLGALADNGGPTPTVALLSGSPAINSGTAIGGLAFDQRGITRVVAGLPDIGAVEDALGDSDPDGDNLDNVTEVTGGTSPVLIDTDSDGFNDATEILSGSDPTLSGSVPGSTRIERVLGFGPARGLDLSGTFVHAFNVGTNGAAGQAGDATFTADNASGVTVTAPNEIPNWTTREFGPDAEDTTLETLFQSIRWADNPNTINVTLDNLTPGNHYKLQLLFIESNDGIRRFDVRVDGVLVADDFSPAVAQGIPLKAYTAAAVVHEFIASGTSTQIVLSGADVATPADFNPTLSGVTLEQTALATPIDSWRVLHGLATDGSEDDGNPSGDGVANLLKYAFNIAPNAGDLLESNVSILPNGGSAGLPAITANGTPQLVIQFVRRKAASNPGVTYTVQVCSDLSDPNDWSPLDLSGATVESIDSTWERVTVTDPTGGPRRFGRLLVSAAAP
ncbi:choice-of-anchor Q domain-containing protein [Haloferula sp. A504]|uniref:choice-of-anchor Q domain-containing protein n=1 Tax=Haloferula sp. A504 TaxID=3373601 RepID=UPI0031C229DC|nr:putative Ig domain-containing protein [Verrucomicrobiaceae bacterium E54]